MQFSPQRKEDTTKPVMRKNYENYDPWHIQLISLVIQVANAMENTRLAYTWGICGG